MADPHSSAGNAAVRLAAASKSFRRGGEQLVVLDALDLVVLPGEVLAVTGPSGSGKSTLLHLAAGLDLPDRGTVEVAGRDLSTMSVAARATFRREHIGLVFQAFHLMPHLTVRENIAVPGLLAERGRLRDVWARADELIEALGLGAQADQRAGTLSGGQAQRVAIGRAMYGHPAVVLADEPTGNLDGAAEDVVVDLLWRQVSEQGATLLVATHDPHIAGRADRRLELGSAAAER